MPTMGRSLMASHVAQQGLNHEYLCPKVYSHNRVPNLPGEMVDIRGGHDACRMDQSADGTQRFTGSNHCIIHRGSIGHIQPD